MPAGDSDEIERNAVRAICLAPPEPWPTRSATHAAVVQDLQFRRLLLRFERISAVHYALKTLAYTMINLRHYCRN
jgi:hypothetical protein